MNESTLKVMFSSEKEEWETPEDLFNELNKEFNFKVDVCALPENAKCEEYFTPEDNGLNQNWIETCWMNPPYGATIKDWLRKAYLESLRGSRVVALIPSRTDTKYWDDYVMKAEEIRFVKGRLKFGGSKNSAPFPSAIVVFNNHNNDYPLTTMYDPKIPNNNDPKPAKAIYHPINPIFFK